MLRLTVAALCLALCASAPTSSVSDEKTDVADVRKAVQDKASVDNPMAPFLEIMKDALNPNPELKSFLDKSLGIKASKDGDIHFGDTIDYNALMMKMMMAMTAAMNPPKNADGSAGDPVASVLHAIEQQLQPMADAKDADPLLKLMHTGVKLLIAGEAGETINPFALLLEIIAPEGKPLSDDPMVVLMTNSIKAAADDKTGDPLNAMVTFVLEDPSTAQNPVVMMAKTMMTLFPQLTQGGEEETGKKD